MKSFAKKLRYFTLATISFGLILSFQNCGKKADFYGSGDGGGVIDQGSSLSFALKYPSCQNGDPCAIAGQPMEFWIVDASILNQPMDDGMNHAQKAENMTVTWTIRSAVGDASSSPVMKTGNPGIVTMEAGLYSVHVDVKMNGFSGTRDFQVQVQGPVSNECLDLDKSFLINGAKTILWKDGASSSYDITDLNVGVGNHRYIDDLIVRCYKIETVQWSLGVGEKMPAPLGDGLPKLIKFPMESDYTVYAEVEVSFPGLRRATEKIMLTKEVSVKGDASVCNEAMDFPHITVSGLSFKVGSSINLDLSVPLCWEGQFSEVDSVEWVVDGKKVENLDVADMSISITASRSGKIPVLATVRYKKDDKSLIYRESVIETSFIIQGQSCPICSPKEGFECIHLWCPPEEID